MIRHRLPTLSKSSYCSLASSKLATFKSISVNYSATSNRASCFTENRNTSNVAQSYTLSTSVRFGQFLPYRYYVTLHQVTVIPRLVCLSQRCSPCQFQVHNYNGMSFGSTASSACCHIDCKSVKTDTICQS